MPHRRDCSLAGTLDRLERMQPFGPGEKARFVARIHMLLDEFASERGEYSAELIAFAKRGEIGPRRFLEPERE